jgi:hypothetical protein
MTRNPRCGREDPRAFKLKRRVRPGHFTGHVAARGYMLKWLGRARLLKRVDGLDFREAVRQSEALPYADQCAAAALRPNLKSTVLMRARPGPTSGSLSCVLL